MTWANEGKLISYKTTLTATYSKEKLSFKIIIKMQSLQRPNSAKSKSLGNKF